MIIHNNRPLMSWRNRRGFTLIEVMAAVLMISIALLAVFNLYGQSISMGIDAQFFTIAPQLAQQKMAETLAASADDLSGGSGDFGPQFSGYSWQVNVEDVTSEYLESVAESLKSIEVVVALQDQLHYTLKTYRMTGSLEE